MSQTSAGNGKPSGTQAAKVRTDKAFLDRFKEFGPSSWSVDHPTMVWVVLAVILIMGAYSYFTTPQESFPEIEIPTVAVNTIYPGVAPADIESLLTRPLEEDLSTISDIKTLTSSSVEGYSSIVIEFQTTVNMDDALASVREKVDLAKAELPAEAEEPQIFEFNFSEIPVVQVNLAGDYGLVRLKEIGEDMKDELEQIPNVLRVDVRGGLERQVSVDVDLAKLQYYNVAIGDVIEAISSENVNIPGGSIDVGNAKYLVRVDGEFEDPALIEDVVITTFGGKPVYVRDVANVDFGFADRESFARLEGSSVVTLDVVKRSGTNIIETSQAVRAKVAEMQADLPPSTKVEFASDMSEDIAMMVSSLENNIVTGLILIVGVLLFFLGLANSVFVAIAIPISLMLTFILIKLVGLSLNMVVLFSLILALGNLVDVSIVVVENIYRYLEEGWDHTLAAKKATGEMAMPVIGSTLTNMVGFVPLMFWPGIVGEFMGYLPQTLIICLTAAMFTALIIVPTLCALYMKLDHEPRRGLPRAARWTIVGAAAFTLLMVALQNVLTAGLLVLTAVGLWWFYRAGLKRMAERFMHEWEPRILGVYQGWLRWALAHRAVMMGGAAGALVLTVALFVRFNAGIEFFPENVPPRQVWVDVELPVGTHVEATDTIVRRLEQELQAVPGRADWESTVATVGGGGNMGDAMMGGGPQGPGMGRIALSFIDYQERQYDAFQTLEWMQQNIGRDVAGAIVSTEKMAEGPPTGAPVTVEITGPEPDELKRLSDQVLAKLRGAAVFPKLVGLESDLDEARPELSVTVDREKAALYGLTTADVGRAVRGAIQGIEAAKYRTGEDEYDVLVRLAPEYRNQLEHIGDLTVMSEGTQIPISSIATWEVGEGYGTIRRKDQQRMATITSSVAQGLNNVVVLNEVKATLAPFIESELPPGYFINYAGQNTEQAEAESFLFGAFMTAVMLIGMVLVSQFNSVIKPLIILSGVVLSIMGVLIGLMVFQMPFGVIMVGVGIISLAGVVVNNGIVLIDYTDILRERDGMGRLESLVKAGVTRWRPVMLTALTTAIGLVPMAIGLNLDFITLYTELDPQIFFGGDQAAWWGSMSVTVLVGVLAATFLTLLLVPVMVSLADDFADFLHKHYVGGERKTKHLGFAEPERLDESPLPGLLPGREAAPEGVVVHAFEALDPRLRPATE
jgi:multidrug efflux pump subunit AcrB